MTKRSVAVPPDYKALLLRLPHNPMPTVCVRVGDSWHDIYDIHRIIGLLGQHNRRYSVNVDK